MWENAVAFSQRCMQDMVRAKLITGSSWSSYPQLPDSVGVFLEVVMIPIDRTTILEIEMLICKQRLHWKKKVTIEIKAMSAGTHGEAQLSHNYFMSLVITEIIGIPIYPFSFEVYYFLKIPCKNPFFKCVLVNCSKLLLKWEYLTYPDYIYLYPFCFMSAWFRKKGV